LTTVTTTPIYHVIPSHDVFDHSADAVGSCTCGPRLLFDTDPNGLPFMYFQHMSMVSASNPPVVWDWSDPQNPLPRFVELPPSAGGIDAPVPEPQRT
jgi:hypothetical protein